MQHASSALPATRMFVTGGSRGVGRDIVMTALMQGSDVAFTYNTGAAQAQAVMAEAATTLPQRRCLAYGLDVKDPEAVERVVGQAVDDLGGMDAVVCNAGITRNGLASQMSNAQWAEVIDTNLSGAFYVVREFLPVFLAAGAGRFVLISSIAKDGIAGQANYSASKAGLVGLSGAVAKEYGRKGITSNVVVPGFFETDMTRSAMSDSLKKFWLQHCPLKRMGRLEELSQVALFLTSTAASFVNGQVVSVTGGLDWAG